LWWRRMLGLWGWWGWILIGWLDRRMIIELCILSMHIISCLYCRKAFSPTKILRTQVNQKKLKLHFVQKNMTHCSKKQSNHVKIMWVSITKEKVGNNQFKVLHSKHN
jgi:hypothetical protein